MITGTGSLSLRKTDLENQKVPAVGFLKTKWAHLCTAGQTSINLNALTTPTQLSSVGFSQPTIASLTGANLLFYRNNLRLTSSLRGVLADYLSYTVSSSSVITLLYAAAENEILIGEIDYNAQTGIKVVDARPLNATGTLPINTRDFNVGTPFKVAQYATTQIGAVLVFVDGVLQYRNSGNSSVTLDGNYYEVDNGDGLGTVIRFNVADNTNILNICVVGNGLLSERPDGSMMAAIENVQGQINNMAPYVAAASGQTVNTVLGGSPTNSDLKFFGDSVSAIAARAKTPTQTIFTSGSGTYSVPAGATWLRVRMIGGGGGGAGGSGTVGLTAISGGAGGSTTFGGITCGGGGGGTPRADAGQGGTATLGSGAVGIAFVGGGGGGSQKGGADITLTTNGGIGGSSPFAGGASGSSYGGPNLGFAGVPNTGTGGGGGGGAYTAGSGGGAGGFVDAIIATPSTTYSYSVGIGGTAGVAANSFPGGAGGSGVIVIEEHYNY